MLGREILSIEEDQECEGGEIGDEREKKLGKSKSRIPGSSGYRSEVICGVGERGIRGVWWCSDNKEIGRGRGRNSRYEHEHEHKHERREYTDGAGMRESGNIRRMINSAEVFFIFDRKQDVDRCCSVS